MKKVYVIMGTIFYKGRECRKCLAVMSASAKAQGFINDLDDEKLVALFSDELGFDKADAKYLRSIHITHEPDCSSFSIRTTRNRTASGYILVKPYVLNEI